MSNKRGATSQNMNNNQVKIANQNIEKRTEIEKELNIQRNPKNKGKMTSISDMEKNHLNYYNEIAKHNAQGKMNNPTLKEIVRITSDESCLNQIKEKEKTNEIHKLLEHLPLMRVERINYKNKEIGHMRRELGKYCMKNPYVYIDQKKGEEFANSMFQKRLKSKGKQNNNNSSNITIDKLYHRTSNTDSNKSKLFHSNTKSGEIWTRKYRLGTSSTSRGLNVKGGTDEKSKFNDNTYSMRSQKTLEETEKKVTDAINSTEIRSNKRITSFLDSQKGPNKISFKNKNGENTLYAKNLKNSFNQASGDTSKVTYLDSTQKRGMNSNKNFNLKSNESTKQKDNIMKISVRRRNNTNEGNFGGKILVQKNNNIERRVRTRK
jgi:hypothetical protein